MKAATYISITMYCLITSSTYAQTESSTRSTFELGPSLSGGISVFSGTAPEDITARPRTSYSFGLMSMFHLLDDLSLITAVNYDSRSFHFESMADPASSQTIRANYLSLQNGVTWKKLFLILVIGLPLSAHQTVNPDPYIYTTEQNPDPIEVRSGPMDISMRDILLDIRLGTLLPVMKRGDDHLDLVVQGSYGPFKIGGDDGFYTVSSLSPVSRITTSSMVSAQIGLSYFFSLKTAANRQ